MFITEILDLVRRHRGRSIAVFGSVARGEANSGSDIGFLVEFDPSSSLLDLVHLEEALAVAGRRSTTTACSAVLRRAPPCDRAVPSTPPIGGSALSAGFAIAAP